MTMMMMTMRGRAYLDRGLVRELIRTRMSCCRVASIIIAKSQNTRIIEEFFYIEINCA